MSTEHTLQHRLISALRRIIPDASLYVQNLPNTDLKLWLIEPDFPAYKLTDDVIQRIWQDVPYWIFCWASGLALAQWLLDNPDTVAGKTVLDFGAGSGVVGIAAKKAGAQRVIACDIDPMSLQACRANAALNAVQLEYLDDIYALDSTVDVLLAADVLYDLENRFFLDVFREKAHKVWVADSRVKNFSHPHYEKLTMVNATTWPDLDEAREFRDVSVYGSVS